MTTGERRAESGDRTDARAHGRTGAPDRREALKAMSLGALGVAAYGLPAPALERFQRELARGQYTWKFFTTRELETMRVLADLVVPRDERSGSATEAGTVEYADFVLSESGERTRQAWHDGCTWLDAECGRRFAGRRFVDCGATERAQLLDAIAWPSRAAAEVRPGAEWFTRVRDLVGSGFFSSQMGVQDLGYEGGVFHPEWRGAPDDIARELGVSYAEWDRRYGGERGEGRGER